MNAAPASVTTPSQNVALTKTTIRVISVEPRPAAE